MKRLLRVLVLAGPLLACSREKTYSGTSTQNASAAEPRAGVARPSDLSAEQVRLVQRALSDKGFSTEPGTEGSIGGTPQPPGSMAPPSTEPAPDDTTSPGGREGEYHER